MVIGVAIYTGGRTVQGQFGTEYSIEAHSLFAVLPEYTYGNIKTLIYQDLDLDQNLYSLRIRARVNTSGPGHQAHFRLVPINNDETWNMMYNMTANLGSQYQVLDLVVDVSQVQSSNTVRLITQVEAERSSPTYREQLIVGPSRGRS